MSISKEQAIHLLKSKPYKVGHFIGFKDLTALHNAWLLDWLYGTGDSTTQAHRGSYKTTDLAIFLALNVLVHPSENVIFLRKTDTDVAEVIRLTGRVLRSGAMAQLCDALYGTALLVTKETMNELQTNIYTNRSGAVQILGIGIGGSITGKHADIVITDDIINIKDRVSRAERERTKLMYMELQNVKNRGGRIINTGTPWHKEDAFTLMPNIRKYDCYTTGLMTEDEIRALRESMSASLFSANYELKHIADEDAMFTDPNYTRDIEAIYNGICHIDASYGGQDSTAFTILHEHHGQLIIFGKKYTKHVDECLDDIHRLKERYKAGTIWCEKNADKGYLRKALRERGELAETYHEGTNKHIKISTYLKGNWSRIFFLEETDPEYIAEVLDYNEHAPHDDCPDSLASIIRQVSKKAPTLNKTTGVL